MITINSHTILVLLIVFAVIYAIWTMVYLNRLGKTEKKKSDAKEQNPAKRKKGDIIGKSRFVLPLSGQSPPEATVTSETELDTKKENIFAPASVPEHPRQIAPEELDDVFGAVPEGETNEPLDINYPLQVKPFPEEEAEETEDEDESEDLPIKGKPVAQGVSFEQMGEAYRHVVHNPTITEEQQEETGRVLLNLKGTDMFEAIVSGQPGRGDKVDILINTYLTAFQKKVAERSAESLTLQSEVPAGFNIRMYESNEF
ncbi:conjugal transfer protein TraD [Bacteroidia bacterium]|nr:conjugal transfer protein TraD [Bacteroidia bacterium]